MSAHYILFSLSDNVANLRQAESYVVTFIIRMNLSIVKRYVKNITCVAMLAFI